VHDQVAFAAAVRELVLDPARRRAMGAAARKKCARDFALPAVAKKWEDVLVGAATDPTRGTVHLGSDVATPTGA
jgi:glycosyltransferase involved in cell wall biosynthesis